ncbi:MAG: glycosyltransferase [Rhizobacter sp.]|nr:glycosyltransferase [Rhizobacter sp.]
MTNDRSALPKLKKSDSARFTTRDLEEGTPAGKVVHLIGSVDDDVFRFLEPAASALADAAIEQSIVFVHSPQMHRLRPRIHVSVRVVVAPPTKNPLRRWVWALRAFRNELVRSPTQGVHLYGLLPRLVGTWMARRAGIAIALQHAAYKRTAPAAEVTPLTAAAQPSVARVERPVSAEFFAVPRHEARHPLIVTGSHSSSPHDADLFAQLAVLLGDSELGLAFNWIGSIDDASRLRLKAAQVGVFPVNTTAEWASRLAAGWVYLAPGGESGFPSLLVEAMAVGLPCVAVDTPDHRSIVRHGESGYLCRTAEEMVNCIAPLIDSVELRRKIGQAARRDIEERFDETRFREALFAAYDLPIKTPHAA